MKPKEETKARSWKSLTDFRASAKVLPFAASAATLAAAILPFAGWAGGVVMNCTEADLRAAMIEGGTVSFACDGTISLASTITNTLDTVLDGTGHQITISGGHTVRVFWVNTNVTFTTINLTIADGTARGGAGILNDGGTLNLAGVGFQDNTATINVVNDGYDIRIGGGAVFNRGGAVSATNCAFLGNQARNQSATDAESVSPYGGAVRNQSGQMFLQQCRFEDNTTTGGRSPGMVAGDNSGGGAVYNDGTLTLNLCAFARNSATGGNGNLDAVYGQAGTWGGDGLGGAIFNSGQLLVMRSTLAEGAAVGGRGGAGGAFNQQLGLEGGKAGAGSGGGIFNLGTVRVDSSTIRNNSAAGGAGGTGGLGGIFVNTGLTGGVGGTGGSGNGGALLNRGTAVVINSTLAANRGTGGSGGTGGAGGPGPGLSGYGGAGGTGGNGGSGYGGIHAANGVINVTNCTIAGNWAGGGLGGTGGAGGSGTHPGSPGSAGTNGTAVAGGIHTQGGTLVNTLLAANAPGGNGSGIISDAGHNLSSDATCNFTNVGSLNNTDPSLGSLADNGGPTLTMALLAGSPAIDAGDFVAAPFTDQRGFPRAGLAPDIGALEYGSMLPLLTISRSGTTGLNITAYGNAGNTCRLLASTDLSQWVPVATNQISGDGTVLFQDNFDPQAACRFYRLVMP